MCIRLHYNYTQRPKDQHRTQKGSKRDANKHTHTKSPIIKIIIKINIFFELAFCLVSLSFELLAAAVLADALLFSLSPVWLFGQRFGCRSSFGHISNFSVDWWWLSLCSGSFFRFISLPPNETVREVFSDENKTKLQTSNNNHGS